MTTSPMQGMHSMWNDHYKGSVYPLALNEPPFNQRAKTKLSLIDACCAYIVKDSTLTKAAIASIPNTLYVNLMEAALLGNHNRSIHMLMSKWTLNSLVLVKLVPSVFTSPLPFYEPLYQSQLVRQGLRYTTSLAHTFLECLRQNSQTKIRFLDLTGFPTAEVILYYLASHCMLVHNEARRDNMVTLYNQAVNKAEEFKDSFQDTHDAMDISTQNYLPQDISIAIRLDAFVTTESCHSELCKALTVSGFPTSRFQIIVKKLSITCLGGDRVNLLLRQIKRQDLEGLQLKYNSIRDMDFVRMAPTIQSMNNLTALDLSCNHISLNNDHMPSILGQSLSTLTKLQRLDLSNCRVKNKLGVLLRSVSFNLKQLRLAACGLTGTDLFSLSMFLTKSSTSDSSISTQIEELDLSENNFNASMDGLIFVLLKIQSTIKIFEMEDCLIDDEMLSNIQQKCFSSNSSSSSDHQLNFNQLLYLNLADNSLSSGTLTDFMCTVSKLQKLNALKLSYSRDCYPSELLSEVMDEEESKELLKASMTDVLRQNTNWDCRKECAELIFVDLEKL